MDLPVHPGSHRTTDIAGTSYGALAGDGDILRPVVRERAVEYTVSANGSFDGWYRAEHARVLGLLTVVAGNADVAREATAEAFTRALERWDRVGAMDSPSAWTYRVGVNLLQRRVRRAAFERRVLRAAPQHAAPPPVESELWDAVRALPVRQRTAVALRYVCDLPHEEIAAVMGVAVGTVSATLTAARRRLAAALREPDPAIDRLEARLD